LSILYLFGNMRILKTSMKRKVLLLISILLVVTGIFLLVQVAYSLKEVTRGGLQVTANATGKAYLNNDLLGELPIRKLEQAETIPAGTYELRIVPDDKQLQTFTTKIRINGGVLTAVDKTFLPGSLGSAYALTLEKNPSQNPRIEITSIPDGALVTIDSIAVGSTPYISDDLSASEHEVELQKEGFAKKTIRVRTVENHTLVVNATLGTGEIGSIPQPSPTSTSTTVAPSPTLPPIDTQTITILSTPNGFLRVRSGAGTGFGEVTRVDSGETFDLISESNGWYQIKIDETTSGWVSGQFARKNTNPQ